LHEIALSLHGIRRVMPLQLCLSLHGVVLSLHCTTDDLGDCLQCR